MTSMCELLEAFCWKSKIQTIWKSKPEPHDDFLKRLHAEAAVFNAVYRCKNSTVPSYEKITQTIKFLEENDFWRTNSLSLFAGSSYQGVIRTVKKLQSQSIRDLWRNNESEEVCENNRHLDKIDYPEKRLLMNPPESVLQNMNEIKSPTFCTPALQQQCESADPYGRQNGYFYLQNNNFHSMSLMPLNSQWLSQNDIHTIQQYSIQVSQVSL